MGNNSLFDNLKTALDVVEKNRNKKIKEINEISNESRKIIADKIKEIKNDFIYVYCFEISFEDVKIAKEKSFNEYADNNIYDSDNCEIKECVKDWFFDNNIAVKYDYYDMNETLHLIDSTDEYPEISYGYGYIKFSNKESLIAFKLKWC